MFIEQSVELQVFVLPTLWIGLTCWVLTIFNVICYCFRFRFSYAFLQKFVKRPTISQDFWHDFFKDRFLDYLKCILNRKRTFWCSNKKKLKKSSKPSRLNQSIRQDKDLNFYAPLNGFWIYGFFFQKWSKRLIFM